MDIQADSPAGLISRDEIQRKLRERRKAFFEKTIPSGQEGHYTDDDWEVVRYNKRTVRVRKSKPVDQQLEDETWSLLARMGFQYMNEGRQFAIPLSGVMPSVPPKQIDVLGIDDDTALVIECKASATARRRSLQRDLNETRGLQDAMRQTIHGWFESRPRVCFVYVTRNIAWSRQDLMRAKANQIVVIRDRQLLYYNKLIGIIGSAARHQLQADLLQDSTVQGLRGTVPALRGTFGGKTFYQFVIEPERLLKISYISHRTRVDASSVGTYQRLLRKKRLRDIARHIDDTGGIFPTSVVVNFRHSRRLRFDIAGPSDDDPTVLGTLHLPNRYKSAWVIDGQHRLYGFALSDWARRGKIPVLAFENLDPADEVRMFVDINSKQVKVPRSLLVELEPELSIVDDSPDVRYRRLHSQIAIDLSESHESPLWDRVSTEWETDGKRRPVTLPQLAHGVRGSQLVGSIRVGAFHFGHLYLRDDQTTRERAREVIERYLSLFSEGAPVHWDKESGHGGFLCTNLGVAALLRAFKEMLDYVISTQGDDGLHSYSPDAIVEMARPLAEPVVRWFCEASDAEVMDRFRGHYGSGAIPAYAFGLMEIVHRSNADFAPKGLEDHIQQYNAKTLTYARELIADIEDSIRNVTFSTLKEKYGTANNSWWREGVPQKVRGAAALKAETSTEGGEPHQFLDLLDYKKIAEWSKNWPSFQDLWSVEESARSKADRLAWMDRLSGIRNRVSHSGRRRVTSEEVVFLERIWEHVEKTIK